MVGARVMRPSAFLAARRGDGSPSLPFPLPPRDAPHRGVGVHRGYRARPPVEEVHRGGGVGPALRALQHPPIVGRLRIRNPERNFFSAGHANKCRVCTSSVGILQDFIW